MGLARVHVVAESSPRRCPPRPTPSLGVSRPVDAQGEHGDEARYVSWYFSLILRELRPRRRRAMTKEE